MQYLPEQLEWLLDCFGHGAIAAAAFDTVLGSAIDAIAPEVRSRAAPRNVSAGEYATVQASLFGFAVGYATALWGLAQLFAWLLWESKRTARSNAAAADAAAAIDEEELTKGQADLREEAANGCLTAALRLDEPTRLRWAQVLYRPIERRLGARAGASTALLLVLLFGLLPGCLPIAGAPLASAVVLACLAAPAELQVASVTIASLMRPYAALHFRRLSAVWLPQARQPLEEQWWVAVLRWTVGGLDLSRVGTDDGFALSRSYPPLVANAIAACGVAALAFVVVRCLRLGDRD
jgi:hypothetical protein